MRAEWGNARGRMAPSPSLALPWDPFPLWYHHRTCPFWYTTAMGLFPLLHGCRIFIPPVPLWDLFLWCCHGIFPIPIPLQDICPASTTIGPFPPWLLLPQCSDDAGWSEDRGDTKCLCHLPAAGQGGAEALTVIFCLGWLSLKELDGFPASRDTPGGVRGRSSPLGMGWAQGRGHSRALLSPRTTARAQLALFSPVKKRLKFDNIKKIQDFCL